MGHNWASTGSYQGTSSVPDPWLLTKRSFLLTNSFYRSNRCAKTVYRALAATRLGQAKKNGQFSLINANIMPLSHAKISFPNELWKVQIRRRSSFLWMMWSQPLLSDIYTCLLQWYFFQCFVQQETYESCRLISESLQSYINY